MHTPTPEAWYPRRLRMPSRPNCKRTGKLSHNNVDGRKRSNSYQKRVFVLEQWKTKCPREFFLYVQIVIQVSANQFRQKSSLNLRWKSDVCRTGQPQIRHRKQKEGKWHQFYFLQKCYFFDGRMGEALAGRILYYIRRVVVSFWFKRTGRWGDSCMIVHDNRASKIRWLTGKGNKHRLMWYIP